MKSKLRMSKEDVSKDNRISQCESPTFEHEISRVIKNESFSKVTVRRKPENPSLKIVEEEDSVDADTSMPINQSYSCKQIGLYKKKDKKKKKVKSSDIDNGFLSGDNDDVFKPKKKKQVLFNVELANDIPSKSLKKKKKREKLIGQTEFISQTEAELSDALQNISPKINFEHKCINLKTVSEEAEQSHTSFEEQSKSSKPSYGDGNQKNKKKKSRIKSTCSEELDVNNLNEIKKSLKKKKKRDKLIGHAEFISQTEAELSHALQNISPKIKFEHKCINLKTVNEEAEKSHTSFEEKSKSSKQSDGDGNQKKKNKKSRIESTCSEERDVNNPNEINSSRKKKKHKHGENSENVIQNNCMKHDITEANSTALPTVSNTYLKQTVDIAKSQLLKETTDVEDSALNKRKRKKKKNDVIADFISQIELKTSSKRNKKEKSPHQFKGNNPISSGIGDGIVEVINRSLSQECSKYLIEDSPQNGNNTAKCSTVSSDETQLMDHKKEKRFVTYDTTEKESTDDFISQERDVNNPNEINSSRKKKKHKHGENSESVIQSNYIKHDITEANSTALATVSNTYLKQTVDSALNKRKRKKKKNDVIADFISQIELKTSSKRNKKEKSPHQLKGHDPISSGIGDGIVEVINRSLSQESLKYLTEDSPQNGNNTAKCSTVSSDETQLMDHKKEKRFVTYDTTEKESTDDLLGSDSSVFKSKYKSINLTPLINSAEASHKEVCKGKKKSKRAINDTDIITARLLTNALKESKTIQNTTHTKNKKLKTEKKHYLLSLNQRKLEDFSEICPNKQKSKIDVKRRDTKMKKQNLIKNPANEIEKIEQDLLSAALKRVKTNSVDKSFDLANLKCTEESDKGTKLNFTQTLHVSKSLKKSGNKPKVEKINESVKKHSKLKKTIKKDPLEEITSKLLAEALARKQN